MLPPWAHGPRVGSSLSVCLSVSYSLFFPVVKKLLRQAARNRDFVQVYVCASEAVSELHPHRLSFGYQQDEGAISKKLISVGPSFQRKPNK